MRTAPHTQHEPAVFAVNDPACISAFHLSMMSAKCSCCPESFSNLKWKILLKYICHMIFLPQTERKSNTPSSHLHFQCKSSLGQVKNARVSLMEALGDIVLTSRQSYNRSYPSSSGDENVCWFKFAGRFQYKRRPKAASLVP